MAFQLNVLDRFEVVNGFKWQELLTCDPLGLHKHRQHFLALVTVSGRCSEFRAPTPLDLRIPWIYRSSQTRRQTHLIPLMSQMSHLHLHARKWALHPDVYLVGIPLCFTIRYVISLHVSHSAVFPTSVHSPGDHLLCVAPVLLIPRASVESTKTTSQAKFPSCCRVNFRQTFLKSHKKIRREWRSVFPSSRLKWTSRREVFEEAISHGETAVVVL